MADEESQIAGFPVVTIKGPQVGEIVAMAVRRGRKGQGIGRRMVEHVSARLKDEGCTLLEVQTLAKESGYVPSEGTRRFYERLGFRLVETVSPLPSWEPGKPCAIYVRPLWRALEHPLRASTQVRPLSD